MTNFEALKQIPLKNFASMVFDIANRECDTEKEFVQFLEKEIPEELEGTAKEALRKLQCSVTD